MHALLLRGTLHALWRMEREALRDLLEVVNTQGLHNEVVLGHSFTFSCGAWLIGECGMLC